MRATSSSKPIPAAAADFGRRLVAVMPGIVFTSISCGRPALVEAEVHPARAAAAERAVRRERERARRAV